MILAAGRGTRMGGGQLPASLSAGQRDIARHGIKAMIPVGAGQGRPFLDYILSGLADAGCREACLVIGPDPNPVREYLKRVRVARLILKSVIQPLPLGTADAVLAAERFASDQPVLVVNADNLYPPAGLRSLRSLLRAGLLGFRRSTLLRDGDIPAARIRAFALIETDPSGTLTRIAEKPSEAEAAEFGGDPLVSMNAWLLPPTIYPACRAVQPSARGELELQDAVRYAMAHFGERFPVVESGDRVLDLSSPADIPGVSARLEGVEPRL